MCLWADHSRQQSTLLSLPITTTHPFLAMDAAGGLSLAAVRDALIRLEDSVVFAILERARHPRNAPAYATADGGGRSLVEFFVREAEALNAKASFCLSVPSSCAGRRGDGELWSLGRLHRRHLQVRKRRRRVVRPVPVSVWEGARHLAAAVYRPKPRLCLSTPPASVTASGPDEGGICKYLDRD